jgi:hypothetical protein
MSEAIQGLAGLLKPVRTPGVTAARPEAGLGDPSADEAALTHILRVLNRVTGATTLSPVEHAIVAGAHVIFTHLARTCQGLLTAAAPEGPAGHAATSANLADATEKPVPAKSPPAARGRARAGGSGDAAKPDAQ